MNVRHIAWETEKTVGPFYCPECRGELNLKKGKVRIHHFAHKPPFTCQYGNGESEIHYRVKRELFLALSGYPNCRKCEIERRLDGLRPDISLYVGDYPVAIEIQKSSMAVEDIIKKVDAYNKLGIYLLYLFPESGPKIFNRFRYFDENMGAYYHKVIRPNQWEKFIHSLFYGRVYFWNGSLEVKAVHFDPYELYIEMSDWGGGYYKNSKQMRSPLEYTDGLLHIVEDFKGINRGEYNMEPFTIPCCKLWMDNKDTWW